MGTNVAGGVSVIFTAETAQFTTAVARVNAAVGASARLQEAASARLQKAWNQELLAQDRLAQKQEQSARAKELAALKADILARSEQQVADAAIRADMSYSKLIGTLVSAGSMTEKLAAVNEKLAASQDMVANSSGHVTSRLYATQGAAALLEGRLPLRALDRFAAGISALGPVLDAAFPIIGVVALADVLVTAGKKAYEFEQDVVSLRSAIESLNDIQITVDKKLGASADSIEEQVERVLEKTQGKTASLQQKYNYRSQKSIDLSDYFYDDKFKKLPDDVKANYETLYKAIAPADLPDRLARIRKEILDLKAAAQSSKAANYSIAYSVSGFGPDASRDPKAYYDARLKAASQIEAQVQAASDLHGAQGQGLQADIADQQQRDRDDAQRKAEAAARRGLEAQKKAAEQQHKQMESQLSDLKNDHQVTTAEEYVFWDGMLKAASAFPDNLAKVKERMGQLYQEMGRELEASAKKYDEENRQRLEKQKQWDAEANRLADELDAQQKRSDDYSSQLQAARDENNTKMQEMVLAHNVATGAISKYDAAVQEAGIHVRSYSKELERLFDAQRREDSDSRLTPEQRSANRKERDIQIEKVQGEADRTALQDSWAIKQQTAVGGFISVLQEIVAASKDYATQMRDLTSTSLRDLNGTILKNITGEGQRGDWKRLGHSLASNVAGVGLRDAEGKLLGALGVGGKVDGSTPGQALWVRAADLSAKAAGAFSSVSDFASGMSKGDSGDSGGGIESMMGPLISNVVPFLANGSDNFPGGMAVVGDAGPELVNLPRGSQVIPNGKAFGGSVGDTHVHLHLDARGAGDPAQIRAVAEQVMHKHAPTIAIMTARAIKEDARRRPSSMR